MTTITFQESFKLDNYTFNSVEDFLLKIDFSLLKTKYEERIRKEKNINDDFIKKNYNIIINDLEKSEKEEYIDVKDSENNVMNNLKKYAKI